MEFKKRDIKIYVIAGKARQGKTTIANMINKYCQGNDMKSINLAFAHQIKEYAKKITDWDGRDETKPRELLQQLGTDLIRQEIDNEFFINRVIEDIKVYSYFFDVVTIDDARFDLEINRIKENFSNATIIKVIRPDSDNILGNLSSHATEKGLTDDSLYDIIIENDGTLKDLEEKIKLIMEG